MTEQSTMRIHISHETTYTYSKVVFFEPHTLRFKPETTRYARPENFNTEIEPSPAGISALIDPENNEVMLAWFNDLHKKLVIKATSEVSINPYNPFNFLIYPQHFNTLPFRYEPSDFTILQNYLEYSGVSDKMKAFGADIAKTEGYNTIAFILNLTKTIHRDYDIIFREKGMPMSPEETFFLRQGSCRDLAWMQINLLRYWGLAAKFVSGYYYLDVEEATFELHAWLEVYLPGAGWIGFDPTHGVVTGNTHIPVSGSFTHSNTMPVSGTIRGNADSVIETKLNIVKLT